MFWVSFDQIWSLKVNIKQNRYEHRVRNTIAWIMHILPRLIFKIDIKINMLVCFNMLDMFFTMNVS